MNLFVLSELPSIKNHVGWIANSDLEEILLNTCDATFIYPEANDKIRVFKNFRHRLFKSWFKIKDLPTLGKGPNVLLLVGMAYSSLLMLPSLGSLLDKFDKCLVYLFDIYEPRYLPKYSIPSIDYLFLPVAEIADEVGKIFPVNTVFLPHAFNALKYASNNLHRCIDVISYGRGNPDLDKCLQENFNQIDNQRFYFHSTFAQAEVTSFKEHRTLLANLLAKSQISLCFEPSTVERFRGYSPVLTRWFEGWAAGCTIVGKKPFGKGVAELIDWENSTIEIPDSPSDWLPFLEDLLDNKEMLLANTKRNYRESLLRHDWRYRLKAMFQTAGLPIPEKLDDEIEQLKQKAERGFSG
jgi:hypothetical protein